MQDCSAGHGIGHGERLHSWFCGLSRLRGLCKGHSEQGERCLVKLVFYDHQRQIRRNGIVYFMQVIQGLVVS